jgi:hypothetical protein
MLYVLGGLPSAAVKFKPVTLAALRVAVLTAGLKWNALLLGVTV